MSNGQGNRRITIRDIAELVGVSPAAVSFALNGRPGIADSTRERVLSVAKELGWTPNATARALSASQASAVGLVIARARESFSGERFFFDFIVGAQEALQTRGLSLLLRIVDDIESELDCYRLWSAQRQVDGVILVDPQAADPRPAEVQRLGLPAVVTGEEAGGLAAVVAADGALMTEVAHHLVQTGRRHIAYVCGLSQLVHVQRRIEALIAAGRELGVEVFVTPSTDSTEGAGRRETAGLLAGRRRPDAIVFDNEILTLGGLGAIRAAGIEVGAQLAVVSCEDAATCRVLEPAVTAAYRDPADMGRHAAGLLLEVLAGQEPRVIRESPAVLIERASTRSTAEPATPHRSLTR